MFDQLPIETSSLSTGSQGTGVMAGSSADLALFRTTVRAELGERFDVEALLGRGAHATVARVRDRVQDEVYALKWFQPMDKQTTRRNFYRELRELFRLAHPQIVRILNTFEVRSGSRYLLLEYCAGGSLRGVAKHTAATGRPPSERWLVEFVDHLALALGHAHSRGAVHLDLKPENILFAKPVDFAVSPTTKVADFGLARRPRTRTVADGARVSGSPAYMSPEQCHGVVSAPTDFYSLGVVLYELLHGRRPFSGTPGELILHHQETVPTISAGLPRSWRMLLSRLLEKDPERRLTDRDELRNVLRPTVTGRHRRPERPVQLGDVQGHGIGAVWTPDGDPATIVVTDASGYTLLRPSGVVHHAGPDGGGPTALSQSTAFLDRGRESMLFREPLGNCGIGSQLWPTERVLGAIWVDGEATEIVARSSSGLCRIALADGGVAPWSPFRRARHAVACMADGTLVQLLKRHEDVRLAMDDESPDHALKLAAMPTALSPLGDTEWLMLRLDDSQRGRRILVNTRDRRVVDVPMSNGLPAALNVQDRAVYGLTDQRFGWWWHPDCGFGRFRLDHELAEQPVAIAACGALMLVLYAGALGSQVATHRLELI